MQALLLIFFSEIGDKTFFIALLLALQQPRSVVFTGARGGGRACFCRVEARGVRPVVCLGHV